MKLRRYYVLEHKGDSVDISRSKVQLGCLPTLWCNDGLFKLIPKGMLEELYIEKVMRTSILVYWDTCYPVPEEIGLQLCHPTYAQALEPEETHDEQG